MRNPTKATSLLLLLVPLALVACSDSPSQPATLAESVRAETLRFQDTSVAIAAGYVSDGHCVAHPDMGGMGDHWVNQGLIDPTFDAMHPEALLYAPGPGGAPALVGVEYIVIDVGQEHPEFDGHPFDVGGVPPLMEAGVDHWSLHVWLHRANPAGMFAPFNPDVSCD
jgi:hypothetical protein